jgi:hypothetical protein
VLFDTDVLIWLFRGNRAAARLVDAEPARRASVVTYMELLQGARDRREARAIKSLLGESAFEVLPLTENIGHRAAIYMEEYGLSAGLHLPDALIAATAVECRESLCSADRTHYKAIKDLELRVFAP